MTFAILLAAGKGSRMKMDTPKQFLKIHDREVIYYSLRAFQECDDVDNIILVTNEENIDFCREHIVERYGFTKVSSICAGGSERYDSVHNGLMEVSKCSSECESVVVIHDGARPLVTSSMIADVINGAVTYGACTVGMPVKDTIKLVDDDNFGINTPDRKYLYQIQTPQAFKQGLLTTAYNCMLGGSNHNITDETMLVEQYTEVRSKVILGSYQNIKITTAEDLEIAEKFLQKK